MPAHEAAVVILVALVGAGAAGLLLQALALRAALRPGAAGAHDPESWPPVTILKPLAGLDDDLFDNIASFCRLDYPAYEIVFCLQSPNDPALAVVRKVLARHPGVDARVLVSAGREGLNPKVRNLLPGYRAAKHELLLISDSNVLVDPIYLRETVRPLLDPAVGLVTNPIRGTGGRTVGAALENLHLNTFVAGGVSVLFRLLGRPCVVGKSMLFRRRDLERLGGLAAFRDHLAEDFVIGREIHRAGLRVALAPHVIATVNRYHGVRRFLARHSRWGKLRRRLGGWRYASELLGNPVFVAGCGAALDPSPATLLLFGVAAAAASAAAAFAGRRLGEPLAAPLHLLVPLKDLLVGFLWFAPLLSSTVSWRGNHLLIGMDTILEPLGATGRRTPRRLRLPAVLRPRTA